MPLRIDLKTDHYPNGADALLGEFLNDSHYDLLLQEDADVYKPDGTLLLVFRKNVIDKDLSEAVYNGLIDAAQPSNNRGAAAGKFDPSKIAEQYKHSKVVVKGLGYRPILADGTMSKTRYSNQVRSGIAGYMDRSTRFPFCRQTAYTEHNLPKWARAIPFLQRIATLYKEYVPDRYVAQLHAACNASQDFIIRGTPFSTVTVNDTYQTAGHYDAGDYPKGIGNLTVVEYGKYKGGYTVFPRYRAAVDVRTGDMLFMDVHELHGNTKIIGKVGQHRRMSIVCYLREHILECGSAKEELIRVKNK